jgi:(2Fe-2S) ferredoxin
MSLPARVLFVGPALSGGAFAELFRRGLAERRGAAALDDIHDTDNGYAALWMRVEQCLANAELPLLVIDLDPQSSSAQLDWLRSELQRRAVAFAAAAQVYVASASSLSGMSEAEAACALIERPDLQLDCVEVSALPEQHAWSCIPPHRYRMLLCNGPRCTRRGALPLWKRLRELLKARGLLETAQGAHLTRTQCQFPCDEGPTLSVYPPGAWYRVTDETDLVRLVDEQIGEGRVVEALRMGSDRRREG